MKEYLRADGEELSIAYTAPAGTDSIVYTVTDLDLNEVLFADESISKRATVTAASGNGTTITYTASNTFAVGDVVTITGLATTTGSTLNKSNVSVATRSDSQFTVTNSTVGTSTATQSGTAVQITTAFTLILGQDITAYDRKLQIDLQIVDAGSYSEDIIFASLVRPYCDVDELATELGLVITDTPTGSGQIKRSDLERLEKRARFLINKITNDKFNFEYKSILTYGQNADTLYIGERIETYDKIVKDDEVVYDTTEYPEIDLLEYPVSVSKSKYHLKVYDIGTNIAESRPFTVLDPYGVFEKGSTYLVRGEFGWKYVPEDIREASILLVEDLRCADFNYRNKGLKSVKNESFDIQYSDSISLGSGNLLVDSFLQDYKRFDLMVI